MRSTLRRWGVHATVLIAGIAIVGACGDDDEPSSVSDGLTFATPEVTVASGQPGDVRRQEPYPLQPGIPGTAWKIEYLSTVPDEHDSLVPVSGVVIVPSTPPPPGGYPIVSWAHGTTGTGDRCAPSRIGPYGPPGAAELVRAGFVVAGTDYYGQDGFEDGPATHPYLVGEIEGRNVLDIARAARRSFGAGTTVVTWGHSQGGHASLWAHGIASGYAEDLDLVGSAAFAPVTDIARFGTGGVENPALAPITVEIVQGWATGYEQVDFDDILIPEVAERARLTVEECVGPVEGIGDDPVGTVFREDPSDLDVWAVAARLNSAPVAGDAPVLLSHGALDSLVSVEATDDYAALLCGDGVDVQYYRFPQGNHISAMTEVIDETFWWSLGRVLGRPAPSNCESL